ncbi:NAD(P)-dependent oxidoreductase [Marinospirillum sp.]|uniref:NAD(P)-dependent oxidoreductase n=1 Tax=Marinospirillum sp. TaxID=2183934 RepID=UPI0028708BAF|nr:NAD(P)-dependent oxidoreductase [Marinospirillum sp.]MDR9468167.1 NAD(P)-dependent oxidoreductase [Marinospirillum sp.]
MQGVLLDAASLGEGVDFSPLEEQLSHLQIWPTTQPEEVVERIQDAEAIIVNKVVLDRTALQAAGNLKAICVLATGLNNIDLKAAEELGIQVFNVQAYGTASVAQHTLTLLLALATRLPLYQKSVAGGDWQKSPFFCLMQHPVTQLAGKKLLLVGHVELGREVERLTSALGMEVMIAARPGKADDQRQPFAELLPQADAVSFHCPLTEETRDLLNAENLKTAKKDLLVVNAARGGIVNEKDTLQALREGQIGGLAVDVLTQEPPRDGNPLLDVLQESLNLIVTPHSAWITPEARQKILELTAENLAKTKAGR